MTLRQAAKILEVDQRVIKGIAVGMKIRLIKSAGALFMTCEDFTKLRKHLETEEVPSAR